MSTLTKTILIALAAITILVGAVLTTSYFSATNKEAKLRNAIETKIEVNKSAYTKMFEILVTEAGVSRQYAKDFKAIYVPLVQGRYNNGNGQLMQWVQEHNPKFETKLYEKLMVSIEAQRESFHTNQEQLADLSREHNDLLTTVPSKWFLGGIQKIKIPVVINDAADKAFTTGKEASMHLFPEEEKSNDSTK